MQDRRRGKPQRCVFDAGPGFAQIGNVFAKFGVSCIFTVGTQYKAATRLTRQGLQALAQLFALLGGDFLRHANVAVLRQKNEQAPGDADLRRQSRTLGADGVLQDLHHDGPSLKQLLLNRQRRC